MTIYGRALAAAFAFALDRIASSWRRGFYRALGDHESGALGDHESGAAAYRHGNAAIFPGFRSFIQGMLDVPAESRPPYALSSSESIDRA